MRCYYVSVTTFEPKTKTVYLGQWWGDSRADAIADAKRDCVNATGVFTATERPYVN